MLKRENAARVITCTLYAVSIGLGGGHSLCKVFVCKATLARVQCDLAGGIPNTDEGTQTLSTLRDAGGWCLALMARTGLEFDSAVVKVDLASYNHTIHDAICMI